VRRREDLSTPRQLRRLSVHYDPDAFGEFSEAIARHLGTARYLLYQTVVVFLWLSWNLVAPPGMRFDPNPFGVLTLALSLQASYAAPLILLAQNRQEARDRVQSEADRQVNNRTQADTEFLAREIAGVRLMLSDVVTTEDLRDHLDGIARAVQLLHTRLDELETSQRGGSRDVSRDR
jgi:uncharacterized membrane protein